MRRRQGQRITSCRTVFQACWRSRSSYPTLWQGPVEADSDPDERSSTPDHLATGVRGHTSRPPGST